jgi:hypothetical protein
MGYKRVKAKTVKAARRKAKSPRRVVSKVNYIQGTKAKGGLKTYGVHTRPKIKHTKRGLKSDRSRKSQQKWEVAYRKRKGKR